jgi:transcriptional regulator with XRE-family HTH domain
MTKTVKMIAANVVRLREFAELSQKEVCAASGLTQGQLSLIENGKTEPTITTLDKLAKALNAPIAEFFRPAGKEMEISMSTMEKIKLIDSLPDDEQKALFKMIDVAVSNKKLKDSLSNLINK